MKFHPILFKPELVRLIRIGIKTHTRRYTHPARPGDVLVVREMFQPAACGYLFAADFTNPKELGPWKPGIHLPYKHCRLFLQVTHARRERLQSISTADCYAEGIDPKVFNHSGVARQAFKELWDGINGKTENAWLFDPYVDVLIFKRIDRPAEFDAYLETLNDKKRK